MVYNKITIKEAIKEDIENQLNILEKYNDKGDIGITLFIILTRRKVEAITNINKLNSILNKVNKKTRKQFKQKIKENLKHKAYKYLNKNIDKDRLKNFNFYKKRTVKDFNKFKGNFDKLESLFLSTERYLTNTMRYLYMISPNIIKFPDYIPLHKSGIRRSSAEEINKEENESRKLEANIRKEEIQNYIQNPKSIIKKTVKKVTWKNPIKEDCNLTSKVQI